MRQLGFLAAAGIYCLDNMIGRLKQDHENAKILAKIINDMNSPHVFVKTETLDTNIVILNVKGFNFAEYCKRLGTVEEDEKKVVGALVAIRCGPWSESSARLVTHCDVSPEMAVKAAEKICFVTEGIFLNSFTKNEILHCQLDILDIFICLFSEFTKALKK